LLEGFGVVADGLGLLDLFGLFELLVLLKVVVVGWM